jgi:flagella basal body P-ring formation protein FlgA
MKSRSACLVSRVLAAWVFAFAALSPFKTNSATAAELRLRAECNPSGPVVTLGDLADIESADARQTAALAATELFPAPSAGQRRTVQVREIQDLLLLRGVNLTEHRFSGSSEVAVQTVPARSRAAINRPLPAMETARIKRRISEALQKYLAEHAAAPEIWVVEFDLTDEQARSLADPVLPIIVAGGCAPWTGSQRFDFGVDNAKVASHVAIEVKVRIVPPIVVARRQLPRGAIIREDDVSLQRLATADKIPGALDAIEDAVGRELVRPVAAGGPVATDSLRAPLAVHRGDPVTVFVHSGAVRIRTDARSREDGSVGELVPVESRLNRSIYYARVTGNREVEVFARPPRVESEVDENPSTASRSGGFVDR